MDRYGYGGFPEYVPVAERRKQAARLVEKLKKKGQVVSPIVIEGRVIAKTFWGKQWCKNLESYSDYESRLPRGRTYVRNGSVIDLAIDSGKIKALVSGSSIYEVNIIIDPVALSQWFSLVQECTGKIDSLIDMLQHSNWAVWFLIQGSRLHRASGCLVHDDEGASNTEKAMTEVPFAKNAFHCSPMLCPCLICLSAPGLSIVLLL